MDNSSVGSNDSRTLLGHPVGLEHVNNYSVAPSVNHDRVSQTFSDDALAQALLDPRFPADGLGNYDD
ncbi:hypothetical protein CASFOL_012202 [Castilleja foliolosa]|uniref:Uncharacterized protein n=1 Tax=Castilleja foliolosa TaxID=1961234 RepID=A0ABD3DPV4_9LAMI